MHLTLDFFEKRKGIVVQIANLIQVCIFQATAILNKYHVLV